MSAEQLDVELLRAVCRANISGIDVYDDVTQVVGTSRESDECAVEFPTPRTDDPISDVAAHFGVDASVVTDLRTGRPT